MKPILFVLLLLAACAALVWCGGEAGKAGAQPQMNSGGKMKGTLLDHTAETDDDVTSFMAHYHYRREDSPLVIISLASDGETVTIEDGMTTRCINEYALPIPTIGYLG